MSDLLTPTQFATVLLVVGVVFNAAMAWWMLGSKKDKQ